MNSNTKIYWVIGLLLFISYGWIGFHLLHPENPEATTVCLFKNITGVPCPSCGVTRSVLSLLEGNFISAIMLNPIGVLALIFLITLPLWVIHDILQQKQTLIKIYYRAEELIRSQKLIYIPLIALIAINWIWNIAKGL